MPHIPPPPPIASPKPAQRFTDPNNGGGLPVPLPTPQTVFVNNTNLVVEGLTGTTHELCTSPIPNEHCAGLWFTAEGSPTVFVDNKRVVYTDSHDTCGHFRTGGSPDVFVISNGPPPPSQP